MSMYQSFALPSPEMLAKELVPCTVQVSADTQYLHSVLKAILDSLGKEDGRMERMEKEHERLVKENEVMAGEVERVTQKLGDVMRHLDTLGNTNENIKEDLARKASKGDMERLLEEAKERTDREERMRERTEKQRSQDMNLQGQIDGALRRLSALEQREDQAGDLRDSSKIEALYNVFDLDSNKVAEAVEHDKIASRPNTAGAVDQQILHPQKVAVKKSGEDGGQVEYAEVVTFDTPPPPAVDEEGNLVEENKQTRGATPPVSRRGISSPRQAGAAHDRDAAGSPHGSQLTAQGHPQDDRENLHSVGLSSAKTARSHMSQILSSRKGSSGSNISDVASHASQYSETNSQRIRLLHNTPALATLTEPLSSRLSVLEQRMANLLTNPAVNSSLATQDADKKWQSLQDQVSKLKEQLAADGALLGKRVQFQDETPSSPSGIASVLEQVDSLRQQLSEMGQVSEAHTRAMDFLNEKKLDADDDHIAAMKQAMCMLEERMNDLVAAQAALGSQDSRNARPSSSDGGAAREDQSDQERKQQPRALSAEHIHQLSDLTDKLSGVETRLLKLSKSKADRSELHKAVRRETASMSETLPSSPFTVAGTTAFVRYRCLSCQGPAERIEELSAVCLISRHWDSSLGVLAIGSPEEDAE
eukprot:gene22550-34507_t